MEPVTRYIERQDKRMAYQTLGSGRRVVAICSEINTHPDLMWTDPHWTEACERLAAEDTRLILFQLMGLGLSDRLDRYPTLEEQTSDIVAILDAEEVERALLFGIMSTAMPVMLLATHRPDRVEALVLTTPVARGFRAGTFDEHSELTEPQAQHLEAQFGQVLDDWGSGRSVELWDPVLSARNRRSAGMMERAACGPATARALFETVSHSDVREALPLIQAPTRVLRQRSHTVPASVARNVAELIPGAAFHELPPAHPSMSIGEAVLPMFEHIRAARDGRALPARGSDRQLASILFTDIVDSTQLVVRQGDTRWSELLGRHERQIEQHVQEWGGRLVKLVGDGSVSVFNGPAAAIRAARAICASSPELGFAVRAGVHTGECDRRPGGDIAGLAVHVAARVGAAAAPGEVWVSRTVRDLIGGSGLELTPRGTHELRGVPERWELYSLTGEGDTAMAEEPPTMRPGDRLAVSVARRAPGVLRGLVRMGNARHRKRR